MSAAPTKRVYSTLIVEDDPIFVDQLTQYIAQVSFLHPPIICTNGVDALQVLGTTAIDILFLDLSLPDMLGLDLLRNINATPAVVITSSYRDHAIDCFDLDIVDFLPKPYDFNRFLRGLTRVIQSSRSAAVAEVTASPGITPNEEMYVKSGRRLERFSYNDILHIEAYGIYAKVHTLDGTFAVNKRISVLAQELPPTRFLRIHKSYIVNVAHLKRLEPKQLWIKTAKLPIGVTYQTIVHQHMKTMGVSAKTSRL